MVVPEAFVEQEDVPVRNGKTGTREFESKAKYYPKSTGPHDGVQQYHPG